MSLPKCKYCGSTQTKESPSGLHLLCAKCNRIIVQPRPHMRHWKPKGKKFGRSKSAPAQPTSAKKAD